MVTSPPYWGQRDYKHEGQIGVEESVGGYVRRLVQVFREVRRVLRPDGVVWLNLGDAYNSNSPGSGSTGTSTLSAPHYQTNTWAGRKKPFEASLKRKDIVGAPWRVAFALQQAGWWLRSDCIWDKPAVKPENVRDRPTKTHEYVFLLTKSEHYYYDWKAIAEPTVYPPGSRKDAGRTSFNGKYGDESFRAIREVRNRRTVWRIPTEPNAESHFAIMPEALVEVCVLAGSKPNDVVLDPFLGSGTVALVSRRLRRRSVGIELNPEYVEIAKRRLGFWKGLTALAAEAAA